MEYSDLKSLMESGNGRVVTEHVQACLTALRDHQVDPALPGEEYKVNDLARHLAVRYLKHMLEPFQNYQSPTVKQNISKDSLYYSHIPRLPK